METVLKKWGIPILGIGALSAFPVVFMYFNNASEADFSDVVQPLAVFCTIGAAVFLAAYLLTRSPGKSSLIAGTFMLAFCNFSLLEAGLKTLFPNLFYWHTLPIVLVIWLEVSILIWAFLSDEAGDLAALVMCLVFCGLILVNAAAGMPKLLEKLQTNRQLAERDEEPVVQTEANGDMPNVYLLIFDEYANFPQMEEYYHYDNAVLKDFLTENHFTISYDSHNESIYTTTVLTNLMNLDYVVDDFVSTGEKEILRKNGTLFTHIRNHGYTAQIIDAYGFFADESPITSANTTATTMAGENLAYLIYKKTAIYPFYQVDTSSALETVKVFEDYISGEKIFFDVPTFTISYLSFPHPPMIADEHGNSLPVELYYDWNYYVGQYKYATSIMIKAVTNILQNDPNSIILLQSDHGARMMGDSPLEHKNSPLNAVYYQGKPISEIRNQSSVNTLRLVLSRLWKEAFPLVDVPACVP